MQQIFITPNQHQINNVYYDPCILKNPFTMVLTYDPAEKYFLAINNSYIYIFDSLSSNVPKLCTSLKFELKFEILRQQWKDQVTPGKPIGITFEKDGCHPITFYSNPNVIEAWRSKLQSKINQRGFHKLFKAKKKIGKGAFATVYLAQNLLDNRIVAVKAFSKEKQYSGDKGRDSLVNQIQLLRKLKGNSNILNLQGVYETDNSVYVILEHLDGGQLLEKIKTGVRYSLNQTIRIMEGILKGLAFMDNFRIIHRDLKPQNLLFRTKNGLDIVIADFGLATWAEEPKYLFVRCGTPGYVAPQIINIKDMSTHSDPISDVFSAGLIFHFLLMGKSIFPGTKYADILAQNRACDIKFHGSEYEKVDPDVMDLLKKMLQVNPKLRIRAHQALNHRLFKQKMDQQFSNYEKKIQYNNNKQNWNHSILDSPKFLKKQTSASDKKVYKTVPRQNNKYINLIQKNS